MISKLVVWGEDRASALMKLRRALSEYTVVGLPNNIPFLLRLADHPEFKNGNVNTEFIPQYQNDLMTTISPSSDVLCAAALTFGMSTTKTPFRMNYSHVDDVTFKHGDTDYKVSVAFNSDGSFSVSSPQLQSNGLNLRAKWDAIPGSEAERKLTMNFADKIVSFRVIDDQSAVVIYTKDFVFRFVKPQPAYVAKEKSLGAGSSSDVGGAGAPMPGVIEQVMVSEGDKVTEGQPLVVIIAMKMEYVIKAPYNGVVAKVHVAKGASVAKDDALVEVTPSAKETA